MEPPHSLPSTPRIVRHVTLGRTLGIALATFLTLLLISSCSLFVAMRPRFLPPLDMHLTLDGRHALVIHNDLPCVPEEPPRLICGGGKWRREFKVMYSSPDEDRVFIAFRLPEV